MSKGIELTTEDIINIKRDTSGTLNNVVMERYGINHRQLYAIDHSPLGAAIIKSKLNLLSPRMHISKVNEIMGIDSAYKGPETTKQS